MNRKAILLGRIDEKILGVQKDLNKCKKIKFEQR